MANESTGSFAAPPPNAPQEVTQDLTADLLAQQLAAARANERALEPLVFSPGASPAPLPPSATPTAASSAAATLSAPEPSAAPPLIGLTDPDAPSSLHAAVVTRLAESAPTHQPAASNSDSPSRGIPRPIGDPNKQITGGFGHAMEAQYFPLDGLELKQVVLNLIESLKQQMETDLHFTMAITYPRVTARVRIEIQGFTVNDDIVFQRGYAHDKTPEAVAAAIGHPVETVLEEVRQEFTPEGEPENPPDRLRDELGLPKPQKRAIGTGENRMIVDVATNENFF